MIGGLLRGLGGKALGFFGTPLGLKVGVAIVASLLVGWRIMVYRANLIDTHEKIGRVEGWKQAQETLEQGWKKQDAQRVKEIATLEEKGAQCSRLAEAAAAKAEELRRRAEASQAEFKKTLAEKDRLNEEVRRKVVDSVPADELDDAIRIQLIKNAALNGGEKTDP